MEAFAKCTLKSTISFANEYNYPATLRNIFQKWLFRGITLQLDIFITNLSIVKKKEVTLNPYSNFSYSGLPTNWTQSSQSQKFFAKNFIYEGHSDHLGLVTNIPRQISEKNNMVKRMVSSWRKAGTHIHTRSMCVILLASYFKSY